MADAWIREALDNADRELHLLKQILAGHMTSSIEKAESNATKTPK